MEHGNIIEIRPLMVCICIDEYDKHVLSGYIISPIIGKHHFESTIDMIHTMNSFYDQFEFPQSSFELRSFTKTSGQRKKNNDFHHMRKILTEKQTNLNVTEVNQIGKQATFSVYVLFRHNGTWQGDITWHEMEYRKHFNSMLELLSLIEEALTQNSEIREELEWQRIN